MEGRQMMMSSSLGAMGPLLGKLHKQLSSPEHQLPGSLKDGIEHLKQDLEELTSFLVDLSMLEGPNAMVQRWMSEVRELSYDMEDYVDSTMGSREMNREVLAVLKQFRNLVKQARERHERYELSRWASDPSCAVADDGRDQPHCFNGKKKATDLVGIDGSRGELVGWLKPLGDDVGDEVEERVRVVSILGPAGVGKSTLAQEVYREIGGQFERRAFVRASRVPDARRLLRSIISQVRRHGRPPCGLPVQELVDNLRTHLQQKRYFIVIDGLWETTSWDIIRNAFPDGAHCSSVLITTDIEEVALECCDYQSNAGTTWAPESMLGSDSHFHAQVGIFKMEPLSIDDSMDLFFNRVFGSKPDLSEQLKKHSEDIIRKCSGLPLATTIIASVLACQPDNPELWSHVKECLSPINSLSSEDMLKEIIGLSYYSLSQQLKTCLLYFSLYPEGYAFLKTDLVKQWTAEGFISAVAGKGANEVAECCFDELVSRGLVQSNHTSLADEVMVYTVHSTVFDVMRLKSVEENFTTVIDYSETIPKLSAKVRRLSLSFSNAKYATKPEGFTLSPVRSLTFYGPVECLPSIVEFKLLRVLILEFWGDREMFDLSGICILLQLRYFRVTADFIIKLPVKMRGLKYLETLEIYASVLTVPTDIVHLPKLLHLHLQGDVKLPDYVGQLRSLRTLQSFGLSSNSEDNVRTLGEMTNLHDLHITCCTALSDHLERNLIALASSIGKHENLKTLTLTPGVSCPSIYTDCLLILSPPPIFLEKLILLPPICLFSRLPEWIGRLQKLCILKIVVRELRRDDVNRIAGLKELTVLSLYVRQPTAQSIIFNSAAFPVLKYLKFRCGVLRLAFQAEAIPKLRRLKLEFNAHSGEQYGDMLAGIEHLSNLQELAVRVGAAPGAEESDKMAAESVLKETISKHSRHLSFSVRRANSFEEEIPQFSDPAPSSSHLDELLNRSTMVDVTSQPNEIDEVQEVSLSSEYKGANDPIKQTNQHQGVSKFGSWEDQGTHLYANDFETAGKAKSVSQNYTKGDPEALSKDPPSAKASPPRTGSDPVVQKSRDERRANRQDDLCRQQARIVRQGGVSSLSWEDRGSSEGSRATAPTTPERYKPDRGSAVPKFGEWEEASVGESFTAIFNRVREDKRSSDAPATARTSGAAYNRSDQGRKYKLSCSCCGWSRN
ncbi:putative disease resistance RPP13-like protein 2 isoform X2 [Panicum miliaceum]|uniref:Disease resistance RPP13-like protein 2 isoform X2 n=1 Tax=Panicum miliaceum TaxID=4540 RepID=A0A3L6Q3Z7_PANMI|nr:putative disease resistance RPP13-like protein 2 isoform X2 [Panicum miliaceum]